MAVRCAARLSGAPSVRGRPRERPVGAARTRVARSAASYARPPHRCCLVRRTHACVGSSAASSWRTSCPPHPAPRTPSPTSSSNEALTVPTCPLKLDALLPRHLSCKSTRSRQRQAISHKVPYTQVKFQHRPHASLLCIPPHPTFARAASYVAVFRFRLVRLFIFPASGRTLCPASRRIDGSCLPSVLAYTSPRSHAYSENLWWTLVARFVFVA
jgi:hypothetical protein